MKYQVSSTEAILSWIFGGALFFIGFAMLFSYPFFGFLLTITTLPLIPFVTQFIVEKIDYPITITTKVILILVYLIIFSFVLSLSNSSVQQIEEITIQKETVQSKSVTTDYPTEEGDSDQENLAYKKTVTGSVPHYSVNGVNQVYSRIADGIWENPDLYGETSNDDAQWIMVDLGEIYTISEIKVWHYYKDNRVYYGNIIEVSKDGISWETVFDSNVQGTYTETSNGKVIELDKYHIRYLRSWLNGNSVNSQNHWVELQVYGEAS